MCGDRMDELVNEMLRELAGGETLELEGLGTLKQEFTNIVFTPSGEFVSGDFGDFRIATRIIDALMRRKKRT